MGLRAGSVVIGVAGVRAGLQRGELALVVVAGDHSPRTADKVVRSAQGRGVPVVLAARAVDLGARLGRGQVQAAGVRDRHLASGILGRS
ncbi:MAG TPA: ribosomal L7Ae/L30e/S12e/Gadd45 family protein [Gemmatimonadales bacterium]